MKICLWDYPNWESIPIGLKSHSLTFIKDAKNGGCIVICGFCGKSFNNKNKNSCPFCKKDLIYPRADW